MTDPHPETAPILTVEDLQVHFPMPVGGLFSRRKLALRAVDGVSFAVQPGETLGIVGESGCGKSTLGRGILRLLEPTGGKILWLGQDIAKSSDAEMRAKRDSLQIVFQDPLASLDPRMTIGASIAEPLRTTDPSLGKAEIEHRVSEIMREVGLLPEQRNRYPHEFSGGQCQRVAIARAMILKPKLVVCDEPVSALDVSIQAQIVNLLKRLQKETGTALLFISHDLSVVRYIADRILVLYLGKAMELADRDQLFGDPLHPYTKALISAVPIPDPEIERNKQIIVLEGELPSPMTPPSGCRFRTRCPKATPKCAREAPELAEVRAGHRVACHYWDEPL